MPARFSAGDSAGLGVGQLDPLRALSVVETVTRGGPVFGLPKSSVYRHMLAIPPPSTEMFAESSARRGVMGADSNSLVFTSPASGPMRCANRRNRVWVPACRTDTRRRSSTNFTGPTLRPGVTCRERKDYATASRSLRREDEVVTLGSPQCGNTQFKVPALADSDAKALRVERRWSYIPGLRNHRRCAHRGERDGMQL